MALIIALAWYGEHFQRQMPLLKRGILIPGLLIGVTVGLDLQENRTSATGCCWRR